MVIENKFNIGDEVYVIRKVKIKNPCSACNGAGHKIIDGNKFYCSKCNGEGYLQYETKKEYQVIGLMKITLIKSLTYSPDKIVARTDIKYNLDNIKEVPEHHLFATKEEAEARCKKLNEED